MTGKLESLSEDELEELLLDATSKGVPGRAAMARVTAIRTILRRRVQRQSEQPDADARRALELVNATRGLEAQLTELHPVDVASVLADPEWAALVMSDEEIRRRQARRHDQSSNRSNDRNDR